jgi:ubiquitin thioesterase protein OTUB1
MASEQREDLDDQFMENEVNNSFALIDVPVSPSDCFKKQYEGNANGNFLFGIDMLDRHYQAVRRVRGDGNCFFRGFLFALCEKLIENPDLNQKVLQKIQSSKQELIQIGYSEVAIDTFWETFVDYLTAMDSRSHQELVQDFQTERGEAEYLVGSVCLSVCVYFYRFLMFDVCMVWCRSGTCDY